MTAAMLTLAAVQVLRASPVSLRIDNPAPGLFKSRQTVSVTFEPIDPGVLWNELVPTWNLDNAKDAKLELEARVIYPDRATKYFSFGTWALEPAIALRSSIEGQKDGDGNVLTDTLRVTRPGGKVQIRLNGSCWAGNVTPTLRTLYLSFSPVQAEAVPAAAKTPTLNTLDFPQLLQGHYPNGKVLCSPTCVAMMLNYWASKLADPTLGAGVSTVEHFVYDHVYQGTGNWTFNCAFAGSKPGLAGYAARLGGIGELQNWVAQGVPVVCSVSWYLLHGRDIQPDEEGHLVVVIGFEASGSVIIQDPGDRASPRKTVQHETFMRAWSHSRRTSYLIGPPAIVNRGTVPVNVSPSA